MLSSKVHFGIFNRLGVTHECDGRTDGQTTDGHFDSYVVRQKTISCQMSNLISETNSTIDINYQIRRHERSICK